MPFVLRVTVIHIVRRSSAYFALTLKRMLDPSSNFAEARSGRCHFDDISGAVLEKVCEYLYYHDKYCYEKDVPEMEIPAELCLELLIASDYLNV